MAGAAGSNHDEHDSLQGTPSVKVKGKSSTNINGKEAKAKQISGASGTRYQCPRCPKNFSRIENLTRHQANREFIMHVEELVKALERFRLTVVYV